jgi:hypothetical protein
VGDHINGQIEDYGIGDFLEGVRIMRWALLCVLLTSVAFSALFLSLYILTEAPTAGSEVSNTVHGEGISLTLSSPEILHAGEEATFYIDIVNEREDYIHQFDFEVTTKAVSLFGLKVFSIKGYSDRGYWSGKPERVVKQTRLPEFTFPGRYAIELVATPQGLNPLPLARVVIYVQTSLFPLFYPSLLSILSGAIYFVLYTRGKNKIVANFLLSPLMEGIESVDVGKNIREYIKTLSIGQKFVLFGICLLFITALILSFGRENLANGVAVLAYLSLVVGVGNLLWIYLREGDLKEQ